MDKKIARWWDIPTALLLMIALEVAAIRLRTTGWTTNLGIIEVLVFLAGILGLALGYSSFRPAIVRLFGLAFTLFFIPLELGLTMEPSTNVEWWDKLNDLYARLWYSVYDFLHTKPVQDPLLFVTVMALFFWLIGMLAGYQLTRSGKPWGPIIVAGLGLLIIDFYNPYAADRDRFSGVFVFVILFLVARLYYLKSRREWAEKGTTVDPEIGFDLGRTVAISGLALVLVAWNMPVLVAALTPGTPIQKELAKQWETLRDKLSNAVAGLQSPVVSSSDYYGTNLALGAGGTRDDQVVFTVQVKDAPAGVRFYWKARSYDTYDGAWSNTDSSSTAVSANAWPFKYPDWKGRALVDMTFNASSTDIRNLYIPQFPLTISHSTDVMGNVGLDGTLDFVGALADPSLENGSSVDIRSWVTDVAIDQLRGASNIYPNPIRDIYLQLPPDFNRRIRNLANQIAGRQPTEYDKVVAITTWLRTNITYQQAIDTPPQNVDPITWFLFDYKKGFCNYYASAEVLMLRSIGIPARLAVGYAQGEYDDKTNTFTVRRRDAHAWPEVYFTDFGWVEFEPTASQPATQLPETAPIELNPAPGAVSTPVRPAITPLTEGNTRVRPPSTLTPPNSLSLWMVIPLVLVIGLVFILIWLQRRGRINMFEKPLPIIIEQGLARRGWHVPGWLKQWARLSELSPIERMFTRMSWTLPLFGQHADPSHTPSERVEQLAKVIPMARNQLHEFLLEYQRAIYSPNPPDYEKARAANDAVWQEARRAFFKRLRRSLPFA